MLAIWLALFSAAMYGISDFFGGIFAKTISPWRVAAYGQLSSGIVVAVAAGFVAGAATLQDHLWAIAAGLGGGVGAAFLYRGLANAKMNVVAPISGVGSALLPGAVGFALGDRPAMIATIGIVVAFPAIWLVSLVEDNKPAHKGGVMDGVLAGLGFGLLLVAMAQIDADAGLWPVLSMYVASATVVAVVALVLGHGLKPQSASDLKPLVMGFIGAPALLAFYFASHHGLLSVVSVITSLYPAGTVILAAIFLRERVRSVQGVGLFLAALAVTFVAVG